MDNAKNFKTKNIILRVIAFILYFLTAGFMGKLCVVLAEPLFSFALSGYPGFKNMILHAISLAAVFTAVSVFSQREGYNDTELLRFNFMRAVLSYIIAGAVFFGIALSAFFISSAAFITPLTEYFLTPYFLPDGINDIISDLVFFSGIPVLYNIFEVIKYIFSAEWISLIFSVCACVIFSMVFYKTGRKKWIEAQKKKIEQARLAGK